MNIEILKQGKIAKLAELPNEIQEVLKDNYYSLKLEQKDVEPTDGYPNYNPQKLRKIKYPKGIPILAGDFLLDGGMEIRSGVIYTSNLKKITSLRYIAFTTDLYEKEDPMQTSYMVFHYSESDSTELFYVVEI